MQLHRHLFAAKKKRNGTQWKIKRDTVKKKKGHRQKQEGTLSKTKQHTVIL